MIVVRSIWRETIFSPLWIFFIHKFTEWKITTMERTALRETGVSRRWRESPLKPLKHYHTMVSIGLKGALVIPRGVRCKFYISRCRFYLSGRRMGEKLVNSGVNMGAIHHGGGGGGGDGGVIHYPYCPDCSAEHCHTSSCRILIHSFRGTQKKNL